MRGGAWLALGLSVCPLAAAAQSTLITPDVGAARGLGTTVAQAGKLIIVDGGTLAGGNLFHSFAQFSLGAGDTARWVPTGGGAASVANIINRVTGGQVSQINGALDSTAFPNASFFFINPAGIVFGAGAQVNVPSAAYFSTAGELRFAGGGRFAVATPNGSTLSVAAPENFGFIGGQGAVTVAGAGLNLAQSTATLSLSGSDVQVSGSQFHAKGLDFVAVGTGVASVALADPLATAASHGAVTVTGSQIAVQPDGLSSAPLRINGGTVTFDGATVVTDNPGAGRGGDFLVQAGAFNIHPGSFLGANARGDGPGGNLTVQAASVSGDGGLFSTLSSGAGTGGKLSIVADTISLNGVTLGSNSTMSGAGGDVAVTAKISLTGDTFSMVSDSLGTGPGGQVTVNAASIDLVDGVVFALASGTGKSGDVVIKGDHMALSGGSYGSGADVGNSGNLTIAATSDLTVTGSVLNAATTTDGAAGSIAISAPQLHFGNLAFIDSAAFGAGAVGAVSITGQDIYLEDSQINVDAYGDFKGRLGLIQLNATGHVAISGGSVTSSAFNAAHGGIVSIEGHDVLLKETEVDAKTSGTGDGGQVNITAATTLNVSNSTVSSDTFDAGKAGSVTLAAGAITLDVAAVVSSDTNGAGDAGAVNFNAATVSVKGGSMVSSTASLGSRGHGGDITVNATSLTVDDGGLASNTLSDGDAGAIVINVSDLKMFGEPTGLTFISSDTESDGKGGSVTINAKTIALHDGASISSDTLANGAGGQVSITTGALEVRDGAYITTDSHQFGDFLGAAHAGDVTVKADSVLIQGDSDNPTYISSDGLGDGDAGAVTLNVGSLKIGAGGFVSSDAYTFGDAGDVTIKATSITLTDQGNIRTDTFGAGNAGDVTITAGAISLMTGGAIISQAPVFSEGDAGLVHISADSLTLGDQALISTSSGGSGNAGAVTLDTKVLAVNGGVVSSAAEVGSTGASGTLTINATTVSVTQGGLISTLSNDPKIAGQIQVTADTILVDGAGSAIASENQAGNTALGNTARQSGAAGTIQLAPNGLTIANGGKVSTNAFAGAAGDIDIAMPAGSVLTLKGAAAPGSIQTSSGAGTGGRISIAAPLAIASNGGSILALGQQRGAKVAIQAKYFINSSDRLNTVAVDGEFHLVAGLYDVSAGTVNRDLSVLDASKVLRGQCPVARATGQVSQLVTRQVGPYVLEPLSDADQRPLDSPRLGVGVCR